MLLSKTLMFYKRKEVQEKLIEGAQDKEIAIKFTEYFGKRPDVLMYENDVLELAKKKASSFHCSEELWKNPLSLRTDIKKQEMDELRKGWDLILDIDCPDWNLSRIISYLFVKALKEHGIKSITGKYSGNKGFHIAVPFEAFPSMVNGVKINNLFPEAPRRIALYLLEYIKNNYLGIEDNKFILDKRFFMSVKKVLELIKSEKIDTKKIIFQCKKCGHNEKYFDNGEDKFCSVCKFIMGPTERKNEKLPEINPLSLIEVDTILIAPRHLYRMPYSFHEKSGLVSVPVDVDKILKFKKEMAKPENVKFNIPFLERDKARKDEATKLIISAFDFYPKEESKRKFSKEFKLPEEAIREELFPPCVKNMLNGLKDGRKRTLFTLSNFLKGAGWSLDVIEQKLYEWNKRNQEELKEVYLKGQLKHAKRQKEVVPPHNCKRYYQDLGVCTPDSFCPRIKNPLQYANRKANMERERKGGRLKLTEEQKEMRRKYREKKKEAKS